MAIQNIIITLTKEEMELATTVGHQRYDGSRLKDPNNTTNKRVEWKYGEGTNYDDIYTVEINGAAAEIACGKFLGNELTYEDMVHVSPYDCTWTVCPGTEPLTVDVKQTIYDHGHLLVTCDKMAPHKRSDIYVLAIGSGNTYRLAGWLEHDRVANPLFKRHEKELWSYWVPQGSLRNWPNHLVKRWANGFDMGGIML